MKFSFRRHLYSKLRVCEPNAKLSKANRASHVPRRQGMQALDVQPFCLFTVGFTIQKKGLMSLY